MAAPASGLRRSLAAGSVALMLAWPLTLAAETREATVPEAVAEILAEIEANHRELEQVRARRAELKAKVEQIQAQVEALEARVSERARTIEQIKDDLEDTEAR